MFCLVLPPYIPQAGSAAGVREEGDRPGTGDRASESLPRAPLSSTPLSCVRAKLCPTRYNFMGCGPPGSSVHRIVQARVLEWVDMPSSGGSSPPGNRTCISYICSISRQVLYH